MSEQTRLIRTQRIALQDAYPEHALSITHPLRAAAHMPRAALFLLLLALLTFPLRSTPARAQFTAVGVPAAEDHITDESQAIIIAGDSRTMRFTYLWGSQAKLKKNYSFCWVNGGSIRVLDYDTGILSPYLKQALAKHPTATVIFALGINGNGNAALNARRIRATITAWAGHYPGLSYRVMSVNPSARQAGGYHTAKIRKLNRLLKAAWPDQYIDMYRYLTRHNLVNPTTGAGTTDGLHYTTDVSAAILKRLRTLQRKGKL